MLDVGHAGLAVRARERAGELRAAEAAGGRKVRAAGGRVRVGRVEARALDDLGAAPDARVAAVRPAAGVAEALGVDGLAHPLEREAALPAVRVEQRELAAGEPPRPVVVAEGVADAGERHLVAVVPERALEVERLPARPLVRVEEAGEAARLERHPDADRPRVARRLRLDAADRQVRPHRRPDPPRVVARAVPAVDRVLLAVDDERPLGPGRAGVAEDVVQEHAVTVLDVRLLERHRRRARARGRRRRRPRDSESSTMRWTRIGSTISRRNGPTASSFVRGRSAREKRTLRCTPPCSAPP